MKNKSIESEVIVREDGKTIKKLSVAECRELAKDFNPLKTAFPQKDLGIAHIEGEQASDYYGLSLDQLICHLKRIKEKYGNMPIVSYKASTGVFTTPDWADFDVVPKYFTVSATTATQFMEIRNRLALSIFSCC